MKKILFTIYLGVLFFLARGVSAITISPPVMDIALNPGATQNYTIALYNEEKYPIVITGSVETFQPKGESGEADLIVDNKYDALSWVSFGQNNITLQPGELKEIPVTVAIPADAQVGGYYVAAIWEARPLHNDPKKTSTIIGRVATLMLMKANGHAREKMDIVSFGLRDKQNIYDSLPVAFLARINNSGNVHIKPTGSIIITNVFGRVVATVPINADERNVLPKSIRKYEAAWQRSTEETSPSWMSAILKEVRQFAFGYYRAQFAAEYGESHQRVSSDKISFWVIPWKIMLCMILLLGVLIGIKKSSRKNKA